MSVTTTYRVSGMSCGHCVHAVTEEVTALEGVVEVAVELHPGAASVVRVTSKALLAEGAVAAALDEAGYELAGAA